MNDSDRKHTWDLYASAWKVGPKAEKLAALARSVEPQATYRDPLAQAEGHEALVAHMLNWHERVPGGWFETTSFQEHHGRSLAHWNMRAADGKVLGEGISFCEWAPSGKLASMTGFFDVPQP